MKTTGEVIRRLTDLAMLALGAVLFMFAAIQVHHTTLAAGPPAGTVTVTATLGAFANSLVKVGTADTASASVTAVEEYNPPVPPEDEGSLVTIYSWSATVEFSATADGTYAAVSPGSGTYSIELAPPTSQTVNITITPFEAGYWKVTASCAVTVVDTSDPENPQTWDGTGTTGTQEFTSYTFDITYTGSVAAASGDSTDSGTVVTGKTTDVHAGWPIQLGAKLAPADLASKFTWTISGAGGDGSAAINGYVRNATDGYPVDPAFSGTQNPEFAAAAVATLTPGADTKSTFPDPSSPGILKYYYYTKAGSFNASVSFQGVSGASAKTTFSVAAPSTTLSATYQYPTRNATDGAGPANVLYLNASVRQIAAAAPPEPAQDAGILFTHPPASGNGFHGSSYFVQVYNASETWTPIPGVKPFAEDIQGLDLQDPYGPNEQGAGGDYEEDTPRVLTDKFPNAVDYSPVSVMNSPQMWVMYMPSRTGAISIPLASCPWHWGGTLTWNATNRSWSLAGATPAAAGNAPANRTDIYPVWTEKFSQLNPPQ